MILSLEINQNEARDTFSFFKVENAIECPPELWFSCISSSLRMKHSVLILETLGAQVPTLDFKERWRTGENWSWLSPRSLSVITEVYAKQPFFYEGLKTYLSSHK